MKYNVFPLSVASYSICSSHCRIHSVSLHSILFQSSCSEYETITRYKIHAAFNFICSSDARSHGSLFCLFSSLSRRRNRVLREGCVWIGPGSFMWYRSDVNGEANGCASLFDRERALPFSRAKWWKERGHMANRFSIYNIEFTLQILVF